MFDAFSDVYDAMIDWPKRLAREGAFYRRWFERFDVRNVVDMACGTGRHAAMFHEWGLRVEGADLSKAMIDRAAAVFGEPEGLRWVVRGYEQSIAATEPFDAAICVGNSLALASDLAAVNRAIDRALAGVRDGGLLIAHVQNVWRLPDGPCEWQKCLRVTLSPLEQPARDAIVVRGTHRHGVCCYLELVVADRANGRLLHSESTRLVALEAGDLERMAIDGGAKVVEFFGGYDQQPYDRQQSLDLVMVARK
ncbi:MAG: class I SAM-dependent methyltransferase [Thermoguttaceae bacterium]